MLRLELAQGGSPPDFSAGREVNVWRDEHGDVCARLLSGPAHRWIDWPGLGLFWFEPHGRTVRVRPAPQARANVLHDTFGRVLQPAILQALGWQALHASAVTGPAGVFAFCGLAHSGKSTLAFTLARSGFQQFADDALVMSLSGGEVLAHRLPFAARLRPTAVRHFERADEALPQTTVAPAAAHIAAFFLLKQDESLSGPPQRRRVPPARAFTELMTHAHCFDASDRHESRRLVEEFLEIVQRVPAFSLTYRPGFDRLGELVETVAGVQESGVEQGAVVQ